MNEVTVSSPRIAPGEQVLSGTFDRPGPLSWLVAALAATTLLAASEFEGAGFEQIAIDLVGLALLLAAMHALSWVWAGRFVVTPETVEGSRILGGRFRVDLVQVATVAAAPDAVELLDAAGARLLLLDRPSEELAGGVLWLLTALRGQIPRDVVLGMAATRRRRPRGYFSNVGRELLCEGQACYADRGVLAHLEGVHVYQPETACEPIPGVGQLLMVSDAVSGPLALHGGPPLEVMPFAGLFRAVMASEMAPARKLALLGEIAARFGGTVTNEALDEEGSLTGRVGAHPVRIEARPRREGAGLVHDSVDIVERFSASRAVTALGLGIALILLGTAAGGVGLLGRVPGLIARRLFLAGVVVGTLGLAVVINLGRWARALGCRRCGVLLVTLQRHFFLDDEATLIAALTLGDLETLRPLQPIEASDQSLELSLDACPRCQEVGQICVERRAGYREPLIGRGTTASPAMVKALSVMLQG